MSDAEHIVRTAHGRTAYLDRGWGRAIVFIHGVGLHCGVWSPQIESFSTSHRVVAYDTYGHGLSDRPPPGAKLDHYLDQLARLMEALNLPSAVLVGHSMGAMIATAFAATYPAKVEGLIAFNPVYRRSPAQREAVLERADILLAEGPAATVDAAIARWFGTRLSESDREKAATLRHWLMKADAEGYAAAYRVFASSDDLFSDRLHALQAPALFVTGEYDPNSIPSMSLALAAACPNAAARILPNEGHITTFKTPSLADEIISSFLPSLPALSEAGLKSS